MTGVVFPVGLTLEGKAVAVTGDNAEALDKIEKVLLAGAKVTLYAPSLEAQPRLKALGDTGAIAYVPHWLTPEETGAYRMVLSTRLDPEYSKAISSACRERGVWVSCFDQPALSDFSMASTLRRGPLQIAVFTGGASPSLARKIRQSLEKIFDDRFVAFLQGLGEMRRKLRAEEPDFQKRKDQLTRAVEGFEIEGTIKYPKSTSESARPVVSDDERR
jgi:siroheme synthase-like protein